MKQTSLSLLICLSIVGFQAHAITTLHWFDNVNNENIDGNPEALLRARNLDEAKKIMGERLEVDPNLIDIWARLENGNNFLIATPELWNKIRDAHQQNRWVKITVRSREA